MTEIGAYEARMCLPELRRAVQAGHCFTITNRGRAIADLVPSEDADRLDSGPLSPACAGASLGPRFRHPTALWARAPLRQRYPSQPEYPDRHPSSLNEVEQGVPRTDRTPTEPAVLLEHASHHGAAVRRPARDTYSQLALRSSSRSTRRRVFSSGSASRLM